MAGGGGAAPLLLLARAQAQVREGARTEELGRGGNDAARELRTRAAEPRAVAGVVEQEQEREPERELGWATTRMGEVRGPALVRARAPLATSRRGSSAAQPARGGNRERETKERRRRGGRARGGVGGVDDMQRFRRKQKQPIFLIRERCAQR